MSELSKKLKCICMRNGVEIWIEEERVEALISQLGSNISKFIHFDNRLINTADLVGIFTPRGMEERTRRRNGQWQDKGGDWHERNEKFSNEEYKLNKILKKQ